MILLMKTNRMARTFSVTNQFSSCLLDLARLKALWTDENEEVVDCLSSVAENSVEWAWHPQAVITDAISSQSVPQGAKRVCVRTGVVPTGLASVFHFTRHFLCASHAAATRLEFWWFLLHRSPLNA